MLKVKMMKNGTRLLAASLLMIVTGMATVPAQAADISEEKRAVIDELLELSNARNQMDAVTTQMIDSLSKIISAQNPGMDTEIVDILTRHLKAVFPKYREDMIQSYYLIYDRHLTLEDLQAVVAFYKTPVGAKLVAVMPAITRESLQLGMAMGQQAAKEALENARKEFEENGIKMPI
jgi:hypothetical protein